MTLWKVAWRIALQDENGDMVWSGNERIFRTEVGAKAFAEEICKARDILGYHKEGSSQRYIFPVEVYGE